MLAQWQTLYNDLLAVQTMLWMIIIIMKAWCNIIVERFPASHKIETSLPIHGSLLFTQVYQSIRYASRRLMTVSVIQVSNRWAGVASLDIDGSFSSIPCYACRSVAIWMLKRISTFSFGSSNHAIILTRTRSFFGWMGVLGARQWLDFWPNTGIYNWSIDLFGSMQGWRFIIYPLPRPCLVDKETGDTTLNEHSWNNNASVIFLDQVWMLYIYHDIWYKRFMDGMLVSPWM